MKNLKLNSSTICLDKEFDFDLENITELDESLPNKMGDSKTYKSRSPFGIHFQNELMNCKWLVGIFEMEEQNESTPKNNYYFPDLPSFLVTHYMPVCTLWSGLILGPSLHPGQYHVTSTNAIVENWMRIVKITILQKQCKLRPGDFIRKLREGIVGRIKAFEFAFNPLSL